MMTSCCDFDFLVAIVLVVFLPSYVSILCRDLMVMSRPLSSHFFSSGCNLSSTLQQISSFPPIFQVATSSWCRNLNFFCSALLQVATLMSGRNIISDPLFVKGRKFSSWQVLLFGYRLRPPFKLYFWLHFESSCFYVATSE